MTRVFAPLNDELFEQVKLIHDVNMKAYKAGQIEGYARGYQDALEVAAKIVESHVKPPEAAVERVMREIREAS